MTGEQWFVLAVLVGAVALFATERLPVAVTGLLILVILGLSGIVTPEQALGAFSSPTVVLVASLYVVSAGLVRTGVVAAVGARIMRTAGASEKRFLFVGTLAACLLSTLLNNTSVIVLMMPIAIGAAHHLNTPPSRLLMPLSYAAILGGTMTLIGTSTNVLVADLARRALPQMRPLGFFEFLPVGLVYATVGLTYIWLVARRLLPARPTISSVTRGRAFEYVTELRVPAAGPAAGMSPPELVKRAGSSLRILQIVRGEELLAATDAAEPLRPGDLLVLRGAPEALVSLRRDLGLEALPGTPDGAAPVPHETTFAEIVITPASELVGRTLAAVGLHRLFGVLAIALQRRGAHLRHRIAHLPLRVGDTILIQGAPEQIESLRGQPGFLLLLGVAENVHPRRRAPLAVGILGTFVLLAALTSLNLPLLALAAAMAAILTGCVPPRRAAREIDWGILGLLAGSICLGEALGSTGLAASIAGEVVEGARGLGPVGILSIIYLFTTVTTEFVSNSGAAALMVPIAIATAQQLGVDARPFIFAVAFGASASFSTPIGYQTNTLIFGPGGYRFRDFLRVGIPLQVLLWLTATLALPLCFPL